MNQNILASGEKFIIKPLISRAPTERLDRGVEVPLLEKILIDLICDADLFITYQDSELEAR